MPFFSLNKPFKIVGLSALIGVAAWGLKAQAKTPEALQFPPHFYWGTATAAYQVEGGIQNDWSAAGHDAGEAMQHFQRYEEDFQAAQKMGTNMYRMSVEWSRIEPQKGVYNQEAIAQYHKIFQSLRDKNISPMVTLFHFTSPQWFAQKGGWTQEENGQDFLEFVRFMAREFKDDVTYWNTYNEPLVYAFKSYDEGTWPPKKTDRALALKVVKNMLMAHGKAYRAIHDEDPFARVGVAKHITILEPNWMVNPLDHIMTNVQSYIFNEAFLEAILEGQVTLKVPGLADVVIPHSKALEGSLDFIGVNYYSRYMVEATGKTLTRPGVPTTELGWEVYPKGLLKALRLVNQYGKKMGGLPIIITENGLADGHDKQRPAFLTQHLSYVWKAINEGIPVQGYLHWSLLDNFEWTDGYEPKFGLMDKDRKWRPSAHLYQEIIQSQGLSTELQAKYLDSHR